MECKRNIRQYKLSYVFICFFFIYRFSYSAFSLSLSNFNFCPISVSLSLYFVLFFSFNGICFWLFWVLIVVHRLSLVLAAGGYSLVRAWTSHCGGFSRFRAWAPGAQASVVAVHRLSCPEACGIFLHQASKPCPRNWRADF